MVLPSRVVLPMLDLLDGKTIKSTIELHSSRIAINGERTSIFPHKTGRGSSGFSTTRDYLVEISKFPRRLGLIEGRGPFPKGYR